MTVADRLWARIEKVDGCWVWQGAVNRNGYGVIGTGTGTTDRVHRVAYRLAKGAIPDGLLVCHRCDNRRCINPAHLFLGTHRDNMQDAKRKGRLATGERHGQMKLLDSDVTTIRRWRRAGVPVRAIARAFGVSPATVSLIGSGKHRLHGRDSDEEVQPIDPRLEELAG